MAADIEELIPESARQGLRDTRTELKGLNDDLIPLIKNARDAASAIMSVNSNGALVKSFNEAAAAQNKANAELEKGIKIKERADAAAARSQRLRDKAEADYLKQQSARAVAESKAADEYQRRKDKEAAAADNTAKAVVASAAQEAKATAELLNDYGQLSKAYNEAALRAKNYQLQIGAGNPVTVQAIKDANDLGNKLKALDASVGQNQRNVGNYASGFSGLGNSIQQILREAPSAAVSLNTFFLAISNNLPIFFDEIQKINKAQKEANVLLQEQTIIARESATAQALQAGATAEAAAAEGALAAATLESNAAQKAAPSVLSQVGKSLFSVNTLLTLAVLALTLFGGKIVAAFGGASEAAKKAEEETKRYNESLKAIDKTENAAAQSAITRIGVLVKLAQDQELTDKKRLDAVKELQQTYPNTFGALKGQAILEGKLGDAVNKTTEALIKRAYAQAAEKKLIETGQQRFDLDQRQLELTTKIRTAQENLDKNIVSAASTRGDAGDRAALTIGKQGKALQELTDEYNANTTKLKENDNAARTLGRTILRNAEAVGTTLDTPDKPTKTKASRDYSNEGEKAIEIQTKELAEQLKLQSQISADNFKQIADDEQASYKDRLSALDNFYNEQVNIAGISYAEEVDIQNKKLAFINDREEKARASGKLTADLEKALGEERLLANQKITTAVIQHEKAINDATNQASQQRLKILKDESDKTIALEQEDIAAGLVVIAKKYADERDLLKSEFEKGNITEKQYRRELTQSRIDEAGDAIQFEIERTNAVLDSGKLTKKEYDEQKKKLDELARAYARLGDTAKQATNSLGLDEAQLKKLNGYLDLLGKVQDLINAIFDIQRAQSEARLAQLDLEDEKVDKNLQAKVAAINKEGISTVEKEKKITDAEAEAQSQRERIASAEADIKRKQAKADRAATITNIILSTALAVIKTLATTPAPLGLPLAVITGAIGAAQLAAALAAPIPEYALGTDNHPGGLALFGEDGNELVQEPGKAPYIVTTPTIAPLPAGTRVIPEHKISAQMYAMLSPSLVANISKQQTDLTGVEKRLDRWGSRQVEAIKEAAHRQRKESPDFYNWRSKWVG